MTDSFNVFDEILKNNNNIVGNVPKSDNDFNVFDQILKDEEEERRNIIRANMRLVMEKDPDKVGKAQQMALDLELPEGVALDSDAAINALIKKQQIKRARAYERSLYDPVLRKQLTDKNFAAIAHDNVENLNAISYVFNGIKNLPENVSQGFEKGRLQTRIGKIGNLKKSGKGNEALDLELAKLNERVEQLQSDGSGFWEEASTVVGQMSKTVKTGLEGGSAGAAIGFGLGSVTGPGSIFTAKGGFVVGFMTTMALESYKIEAGHSYLEMIEEGIDEETSKHISTGVGLVNAALEFGGAGVVFKPLIKKYLAKEVTKKLVKELAKPTMRKAFIDFSKNAVIGSTLESLTETGQEFSNVIGRDLAVQLGDYPDLEVKLNSREGRAEIADRLVTTFIKSMQAMSILGLVPAGGNFVIDARRAQQANKDTAFLEKVYGMSVEDKTRKRNPKQYRSLINNLAVENGVENLYIEADVLNQALKDSGITIEDLEVASPEIARKLQEINEGGGVGTVEMQTGEYFSQLVGTQVGDVIKPHVRKTEKGMSTVEYAQFLKDRPALEQEMMDAITVDSQAVQDFDLDAADVKKAIADQLRNAGLKYTKNNISDLSTFARDFIVTQARELGMSPSEFFSQFYYNIKNEQQVNRNVEASTLNQLFTPDGQVKTDSQTFTEFFKNSKLIEKDGTPQIIYHGTSDSLKGFDPNNPTKKDDGWAGSGVYAVRGKDAQNFADTYEQKNKGVNATTSLPLYAKLENPYIATAAEKNQIREGGKAASEAFRNKLIEDGHDGIILPLDNLNQEVIIFDSNNVKTTNRSGTWEKETQELLDDIEEGEVFEQRAKPQEQGKPVPDNVRQTNKLENSFDFAKSKPFPTNRQFKIELQERVKQAAKEAGVDVNDASIETEKYLVETVIADARYALIENSNAVGWYNEKVTKAKRILALIHPELTTDPVANFAFTWSLANTSNMIKVDKNFELAEKAYRHYKKTGKFPTNIGIGKASDAINNNFKLFNRLIREKPFEELEQFMQTQHTVKEVKAYTNSSVSGENLSEIVYGAAVMGPKIGNGFYANLKGFFEQLTMDRWLIRSWGRLTGTLVLDQRKQANMKRDQLKPLLKALTSKQKKKLQDLIGVKIRMTNLDEVAVAIDNASTDKPNRKIMNEIATIKDQPELEQTIIDILGKPRKGSVRIGIGDEIRKNGVSYTKFLDGQKEAPSGAPERRFIRKVFNQALDVLQQDNPDLTMADLQALLWYPEKRLYDSAKLVEAEDTKGYVDDEAPDYANAAVGLAKTFGISDVDIQSTLQEVDLEIQNQSIDRARVAESGERRPDGIQQNNETFRQGRRNFDTPTDEGTGLPLNPDGTVTIYHHTDKQSADAIRESNRLEYTTGSDPFFTTRDTADLGYGDTSIAIRLDPARLSVDDEFPDGRRDFRLNNRKARESISVEIDENPNVPDFAPTSDQVTGNVINRVVKLGKPYMGEYGDKSPNVVDKELRDKASALFGAQAATPEEAAAARERIIEKTKLRRTRRNLEKQSDLFSQAQTPKGSRGQFDPKNLTTLLTKEADLSTFLHETAHYMLTVMEELVASGKATQRMIDDFDKLLDFFDVADFDTWSKLSLNEKRKYHESFAYNFEIYMAEEKAAPNVKLQEIFVKFRNFLTRIYKSIRGELNDLYKAENGVDLPILTDEIRGVMDRMLASEQEIIQSQKIYNMKPMFETQESSGMNDAEWADYTKNIQEAQDEAINELSKKSVAQMKWLENAKSKEIKKLQKKERETRNKVKNEEMEKAKKEKAYRLQAFLKTGKTVNQEGEPVVVDKAPKIRKADVKNYIPFYDATDELKRLRGMVADDGVPASLLAELFEYESPAAMINALVDLQDIKDLVKERTDRIMLEDYSELSDPKQQQLAALEAIHNQARAKFIATELRFLSKAMQPVRYQVAAARQVAKDILAKTPLKEIRPSQFARAQARAVKLTEKAMMEGNTKEAIAKKRAQLVQHELAREAIRIHNVYKKAEKNFDKFFKKSDKDLKNTRNIDLINAARSILAAYGVGPAVDNPTIYLDKLAAYNQDVYLRLQPIIEDATSFGAKELTDLTAQQFETLYEQIQSLDYQSRMDKVIEKDGQKVSLEREVAKLSYELDRIAFIKNNEAIGEKGTPTRMEEIRYAFQGLESTTARVEHMMDNFDGAVSAGAGATLDRATAEAGPFTKLIWRPVKNALDAYRPERNKFTKKYAAMLQMLADAGRLGKEKIVSHEIDFTFGNGGTVPGKVELLGAMLHIGNVSNKRKLLLGRGWANKLSDGSIDTSKWDAFMARMENEGYITKDDWDFLQEVWDLNEEMKPIAQKAHREVYGYYFKEIEATPIINKFGTYRGGYVPAALDPKMDRQRKALKELEELDTEYRQTLPSTGDGFTKSRNERFAGPLSLDLRIMTKHIDDALRFAYVQPAIKNVHKILKHPDFAQKLAVINPTYMDKMLIPWLNNAARQKTFVPGAHPESIDVFWQTVRKRTGVGIMFANISNAMQQLTGYFPAMLKVEPRYLKGALGQYLQAPNKFANEIAELSPFMSERQNTQIFDIQDNLNELLINPNQFQKVQKWATHHGYFLQQAFQNQVDSVVWAASYEKTMAELPKTFTFEQARAEAIQQADANVRLTQDSLSAEDLPAFMITTPAIKTFLQFGNYFNMIANLNGTAYKKIMRDLGWRGNKGKLFMTYLLGFAMPAFVADMIVRALGEGFIDDEEDGIADDFMGWYFGSQIRSAAALVPFGTAALVGINMLDNKPYNDRITVSPSVSILEASLRAPVTTILALTSEDKDLSGRNVKDFLTFLSLVTGVPLTILGKPIGYQVDVNRGTIDPTGLPDYVRGLITGKASGKSRN
tara:strand:- start:3732 stop:12302 length:8571 start_codon:yes stop_codon:yes gene_type:complete